MLILVRMPGSRSRGCSWCRHHHQRCSLHWGSNPAPSWSRPRRCFCLRCPWTPSFYSFSWILFTSLRGRLSFGNPHSVLQPSWLGWKVGTILFIGMKNESHLIGWHQMTMSDSPEKPESGIRFGRRRRNRGRPAPEVIFVETGTHTLSLQISKYSDLHFFSRFFGSKTAVA